MRRQQYAKGRRQIVPAGRKTAVRLRLSLEGLHVTIKLLKAVAAKSTSGATELFGPFQWTLMKLRLSHIA